MSMFDSYAKIILERGQPTDIQSTLTINCVAIQLRPLYNADRSYED